MPAVYASSDVRTLLDEAYYKSRRYGWKPADFRTQLAVKMNWRLNRMLDLTDAATLRELGVSKNALKNCDWKASQDAGDEALTQAIARAAFENMAEGLVVPSARNVTGINLVYYPSHRLAGTVIQTLNEEDIPFRHGL
jgi:RES domain-containing protein